jgi:hypothetical protein
MVVGGVVDERLFGDDRQMSLEIPHICGSSQLHTIGVAEDKVAKAQFAPEEAANIGQQTGGVLVDKGGADGLGLLGVLGLRRLQ